MSRLLKVKTFNYDGGRHLGEQSQTICVRRGQGMCSLCWVAPAATDVQISGDAPNMGIFDVSYRNNPTLTF